MEQNSQSILNTHSWNHCKHMHDLVYCSLLNASVLSYKVTLTCVVNFLITCLVSKILKDKERQRHYSSAILDIEKPHDVTTLVNAFSLTEAINKYVECSNPTEFVGINFLRKLRSVEENFIEI